jgi:alpha-tubulin suppressor-like RCC1 family protein
MFLSNLPATLTINSTSGLVTLSRASLATDAAIADSYWQTITNWNSVIITYKTASSNVQKTMKFKSGIDTATIGVSSHAIVETLSISSIVITDFDGGSYKATVTNLVPYNIGIVQFVPSGITISFLAFGAADVSIISSTGYTYSWGANSLGQVGDDTTIDRSSPVSVVGGRQFIHLVRNSQVAVALDQNSYAYAWGYGAQGDLGNNTVVNRSSPVSVSGGKQWLTLVGNLGNTAITALDNFSYAYQWGYNPSGVQWNVPTSVPGGKQFVRIKTSPVNTNFGIDALSYAWGWGAQTFGELGNGGNGGLAPTPTSVVGGRQFINIFPAKGNAYNTLALDSLSYGYAWGYGAGAMNGDNTVTNRSSPVSIVGGQQWRILHSGHSTINEGSMSAGINSLSYAYCWGYSTNGQLGDNNTTHRLSPVSVVGGRQFRSLAVGNGFVIGLDSLSYAYAWGTNTNGQLGDNTNNNRSSPVSVVGGRQFTNVYTFTSTSTCIATDASGFIWTWGTNTNGRLGDGTTANRSSPVSVTTLQHL